MKINNITPFEYNILHHYQIGYKKLFNKKGRILDYGSGNGEFIGNISQLDKVQAYGYDVDKDKTSEAQKKYKKVHFKYGKINEKIPFKDNFFDYAIFFHVLEHVDSEKRAINEIYRVLKKGGILYISSPYNGLFAWADAANIRYRFPKVHALLARKFYGAIEYKKHFIDKKSKGLFFDSSLNRNWHKHYKEYEVRELFSSKFYVDEFQKYSLVQPFLLTMYNIWIMIFRKPSNLLIKLIAFDNNLHVGELSYNFFATLRKK